MARIRTIKHEFFLDEKVAELDPRTRLAFIGLWVLADRAGRLIDSPKRIRAELFPYEPRVDVDALLAELAAAKFIERYEVTGKRFIQVTNFIRHQRPNLREPDSEIPAIPVGTCAHVQAHAEQIMSDRSAARKGNGSGEGEGKGNGGSSEAPSAPSEPPAMVFDTVGKAKTWDLNQEHVSELGAAFPGLDVIGEARKALEWTRSNPANRKTPDGMRGFLFRWMSRAQNSGRAGKTPVEVDKRCDFHRRPGTGGRRAPKYEWRPDCHECKHADARANPRPSSEPTSVAGLVGKVGGG